MAGLLPLQDTRLVACSSVRAALAPHRDHNIRLRLAAAGSGKFLRPAEPFFRGVQQAVAVHWNPAALPVAERRQRGMAELSGIVLPAPAQIGMADRIVAQPFPIRWQGIRLDWREFDCLRVAHGCGSG